MSGAARAVARLAVEAFLFGALVGGVEAAWLVRGEGVVVATPLADLASLAWRYGVACAAFALLAWPLAAWRVRRCQLAARFGTATLALALGAAGVVFIVAGDWVHERALANVGLFALRSLAATAGVALGALAVGGALGLARRFAPRATVVALVLLIAGSGWLIARPFGGTSGRGGGRSGTAGTTRSGSGNEGNVGASSANGASAAAATAAPPPNVIVLVIDTLRADRLGCYGYSRATSPEIDALAARGLVFDHAYAQAPLTRSSVASLFTGLYPDAHGTNGVMDRLPPSAHTLAESMRDAGWRTACFSANENVSPVFGYEQGFDTFWLHRLSHLGRFSAWGRLEHFVTEILGFGRVAADLDDSDAKSVTDAVLAWLPRESSASRVARSAPPSPTAPPSASPSASNGAPPFFLYVQYIDPHSPYAPPEDLLNQPSPDPAKLAREGRFPHNCPPHPIGRWPEQVPGLVDELGQLYDAEIRFCDRELGRLVREIEARGLLRDSWLVITADHGEEFFDHEQLGHGQSMYDELLHVPLIVLGPGVQPGRVAEPIQLVDLAPTLLSLVGHPTEAELHGRDRSELLERDTRSTVAQPPTVRNPSAKRAGVDSAEVGASGAAVVFAQRVSDSPLAMVRVGAEKLIVVEHEGREQSLLFDLAADPREQHDLAATRTERVAELRKLLDQRRRAARAARLEDAGSAQVGSETLDVLKKLGYVGGD